jgi:hypothetical protein
MGSKKCRLDSRNLVVNYQGFARLGVREKNTQSMIFATDQAYKKPGRFLQVTGLED